MPTAVPKCLWRKRLWKVTEGTTPGCHFMTASFHKMPHKWKLRIIKKLTIYLNSVFGSWSDLTCSTINILLWHRLNKMYRWQTSFIRLYSWNFFIQYWYYWCFKVYKCFFSRLTEKLSVKYYGPYWRVITTKRNFFFLTCLYIQESIRSTTGEI